MDDSRLAGALKLPARVLRKYHKGFVHAVSRYDSAAYDDLVADGLLLLVRLHKRLPVSVGEEEFQIRAAGHLNLYYRAQYRLWRGIYRNRDGTHGQRLVRVKVNLDRIAGHLSTPSDEGLLRLEMDEFLEGLQWDGSEGEAGSGQSSGSPSVTQPGP